METKPVPTVEDLRKAKKELETRIADLVHSFQKDYGVKVEHIRNYDETTKSGEDILEVELELQF